MQTLQKNNRIWETGLDLYTVIYNSSRTPCLDVANGTARNLSLYHLQAA
jgi:hypothetical protein